jgi:hypothetical protein
MQIDLFQQSTTPSTSPRGLLIQLPHACRECGCGTGVVGSSQGPHCARVACGRCGQFSHWLSADGFNFIGEIIDLTGSRPSEPIVIRRSRREEV